MIGSIHSESLFSLLSAARPEKQPSHLDALGDILEVHPGDVLEIQGPSGSGKSQVLAKCLVTCLIVWKKAAVLYDLDGTFDAKQFHDVLLQGDFDGALVQRALRSLHIFRPGSTSQLAASILNLPTYHRTRMPELEIGMVAVDSLSAFYWADRFTREQLPNSASSVLPLHYALSALQSFRVTHRPITILTNWGLALSDNDQKVYKQHLPIYPSFPDSNASVILPMTHHVGLLAIPRPPFHGDESPDAQQNAGTGGLTAFLRQPGRSQIIQL